MRDKSRKSMNAPETHFGDFVDPNRPSVLFKCVSGFGFRKPRFRAALSAIRTPLCSSGGTRAQNGQGAKANPAKIPLLLLAAQICVWCASGAELTPTQGLASWYGEDHRGKLMANGRRFNPDRLTAASWFYPLGSRVRVTVAAVNRPARSVVVRITDRGPAKDLVRDGRIIDLTYAAFRRLAHPGRGLVAISVEAVPRQEAPAKVAAAPAAPLKRQNVEVCEVTAPATQSSP